MRASVVFSVLKVYLRGSLGALGLALLLSGCSFRKPPEASTSFPQLEECQDSALQNGLDLAMQELSLKEAADQQRLSIELVDITDLARPRAAGINQNYMMYAASLPKIAILFGLLKRVEQGTLEWDSGTRALAIRMIRFSSNEAASELFHMVGPQYIASLLSSPAYGFYRVDQGGGLWVGKEYGRGEAWMREPLRQLSHAASAMSVARFYYLLETGALLSPPLTALMKEVLAYPALHHKFVRGLRSRHRAVRLYRKGGSWGNFHSDSAIVERNGRKYIAVALTEDPNGAEWLESLIIRMDQLVFGLSPKMDWT